MIEKLEAAKKVKEAAPGTKLFLLSFILSIINKTEREVLRALSQLSQTDVEDDIPFRELPRIKIRRQKSRENNTGQKRGYTKKGSYVWNN